MPADPVAPDQVAPVLTGFFGKLPARGDFVRAGLPGSFVTPWDEWLSGVIAESRAALGEEWLPAWLEAPIWRFQLPAGQCGPAAVTGLWLASVDSAGRYFPLTLAALGDLGEAGDWLDAAEACGLEALDSDLGPAELSARLADAPVPPPGPPSATATWWTDGAPRVPAGRAVLAALPGAAQFTRMMAGRWQRGNGSGAKMGVAP